MCLSRVNVSLAVGEENVEKKRANIKFKRNYIFLLINRSYQQKSTLFTLRVLLQMRIQATKPQEVE